MWTLIRELRSALTELFPTRRDGLIVAGLILFGAVVSAAEMLTAKLFSDIILPGESSARPMSDTVALAVVFLLVFGGLRVVNYAQNLYRVNVFEKAFHGRNDKTGSEESWRWATAMELTTILTMTARIAVIAGILFILSPLFGLANVVLFLIIAEIFGAAVRRQFLTQQGFRDRQKAKAPASPAEKVRARIKAGEASSLLASLGVMVLMGLLIVLAITGVVAAGDALVLFLAVRMIGQMYSGISSGLMRFTRARVNGR
jgi:hypothetical protein